MPRKENQFTPYSDRAVVLAERRNLKMARSSHAYVRGNMEKFYVWLSSAAGSSIPHGAGVWICGDCHAGNLGPIANAKGRIDIGRKSRTRVFRELPPLRVPNSLLEWEGRSAWSGPAQASWTRLSEDRRRLLTN